MSVNILLADDHKMIREGLKQLLEMYDDIKVVGEAGDGFECLNLADKTHPGLRFLAGRSKFPANTLRYKRTQNIRAGRLILTVNVVNEIIQLIKLLLRKTEFNTLVFHVHGGLTWFRLSGFITFVYVHKL